MKRKVEPAKRERIQNTTGMTDANHQRKIEGFFFFDLLIPNRIYLTCGNVLDLISIKVIKCDFFFHFYQKR